MMTLSKELVKTLESVLFKTYVPDRAGPVFLKTDDRTVYFKIVHGDTLYVEFTNGITVAGTMKVTSISVTEDSVKGNKVVISTESGTWMEFDEARE